MAVVFQKLIFCLHLPIYKENVFLIFDICQEVAPMLMIYLQMLDTPEEKIRFQRPGDSGLHRHVPGRTGICDGLRYGNAVYGYLLS